MKPLRLLLAAFVVAGCSGQGTPDARSADPYDRYLGALELAASRDPIDERYLLRMLRDPDPLARDGAVIGLGELGHRENAGRLAEALRIVYACPAHPEVSGDRPQVCPKCNAETVAATRGAAGANTPMVRSDACRSLARLGGDEARAALLGALAGDPSAEVRRTAALAAEAFGPARPVLEALVGALGDSAPEVAYDAHRTLGALTGRTELPRQAAAWKTWLDAQPK